MIKFSNSKFERYQKIKIQESLNEVPSGCIPTIFEMIYIGNKILDCQVGDSVEVHGIMMIKLINLSTYSFYISIQKILKQKIRYKNVDLDVDFFKELDKFNQTKDFNFYNYLAENIAPEIYGHIDIKKALLIQMVGSNERKDLRSNINIMLMGDPGIAKSQFLKFVSNNTPKGKLIKLFRYLCMWFW